MQIIQITKVDQIIELRESGDYLVELSHPGLSAEIKARFFVADHDQQSINLTIHHLAPHTKANVSLKGVATDQSQISFTGKILIEAGCFDTNSFLEERILLLSDQAKAQAIPELEIKCDDVRCSHAATISRLSEEQLFYLMTRGIDRKEAEKMLINGFLDINQG